GSGSPRSPGWTGTSSPCPRPERERSPRRPPPPPTRRVCRSGPQRRWTTPGWEGRRRRFSPADRAAPPSATRPPRTGLSSARSPHPLEVRGEGLTTDSLVRLLISRRRLLDYLRGELGWGRLMVPPGGVQPVPDELLVEGRLAVSLLVPIDRPEPGGIGREHLVDQDQLSFGKHA